MSSGNILKEAGKLHSLLSLDACFLEGLIVSDLFKTAAKNISNAINDYLKAKAMKSMETIKKFIILKKIVETTTEWRDKIEEQMNENAEKVEEYTTYK